jgi:hypothetical protein
MIRSLVDANENIIRAIRTSDWDNGKKRFSSDLFKGPNTSVSRLSIFCLKQLLEIFHRELDRPLSHPPNFVRWAGEINVGKMQAIGRSHQNPIEITVEKDPLPNNLAHAEIPQKLSRGLSIKIIKSLIIHDEQNIE